MSGLPPIVPVGCSGVNAAHGRAATLTRRLGIFAGVVVLVAACSGGPAPRPSPNPSTDAAATSGPTISLASPSVTIIVLPTPLESPTPVPDPTLTPDDLKISALLMAGLAKWDALIVPFVDGATVSEMVGGVRKWDTFFASQVALADAYTPSSCTALALEQYRMGMLTAQTAAEVILDWVDAGMHGDPPDGGDLHPAYQTINEAVASLGAKSC